MSKSYRRITNQERLTMLAPRKHIALAIDGGGIKGLIVAQALTALEAELGDSPLIKNPAVKVLVGTSTGALITAGIAIGMTAREIAALYIQAGQSVFPPFLSWLPGFIRSPLHSLRDIVAGLLGPIHSNQSLIKLLREEIGKHTGNPDLTLGQLRALLRDEQVLVITVVDIDERRTHFLKTYDDNDADWPLWQAVVASSAAPSVLPVIERPDKQGKMHYYTDGGVGSYTNPAYVAAREAVEWKGYPARDVTVFSFGTGWVNAEDFQRSHGAASRWKIIDWAQNAPILIVGDAARAQSLDIINDFVNGRPPGERMDFRRFQIALTEDIALDDASSGAIARMREYGTLLGQRILNNEHALCGDPQFDPEGLAQAVRKEEESVEEAPKG
jgi:uncharacterized protein